MVFKDQPFGATAVIRFPEGTYALEAEDYEYYYFRSPGPLEVRLFAKGQMTDGRDIPGGLMVGKRLLKMVPAGGYFDGEEENTKILVWKLGGEFVGLEG